MKTQNKTIARILKVNHAGEYGAIRIYSAQLFVSKILHKELLPFLKETLSHEIEHCNRFIDAMKTRMSRPCRTMWLWGIGGWVLGFITACIGKNAIMVCTSAIEKTVHKHLAEQINYLENKDTELKELILDIQKEEIKHLEFAEQNIKNSFIVKPLTCFITASTEIVIWLSTQGDISRMKQAIS